MDCISLNNFFALDHEKEMFIVSVQKHPCLYDPQEPSYSNRLSRQSAWEEIAVECGVPGNGMQYCMKSRLRIVGVEITMLESCT